MEIRTLRYFLAVAREENMTRAAEILHVTQPTLSKALKSLEEELGKPLFTRKAFSIRLTDEGMLLRSRAEDLVSMADKIEQEFVSLNDITGGELYFGLAESCQIRYLAKEIRSFQKRYPNLRCHITSGDTEQVIDRLEKGLLDFAVLAETPDFARYDAIAFPEDDVWGLVVPKDHPFARCQEITPEQLVGQPLFSSEQAWNNEIRAWAKDLFAGYKLEGSFRLAYNGAVFTREGLGYLLTFEHLVDTSESSGLAFIPLAPRLTTTLYLVHSRFQACTPIALRFLDQIRSSFEKQAEQTAS